MRELEERIELLKGTPIFERMDAETLRRVAEEVVPVRLNPGELLVRQGEQGACAWVVVYGRLLVYCQGPDGKKRVLGEVVRGESVGEVSLLADGPRAASVRAVRETGLLKLSAKTFLDSIMGSADASLAVLRLMANRLSSSPMGYRQKAPQSIACVSTHANHRVLSVAVAEALRTHQSVDVHDAGALLKEVSQHPDDQTARSRLGMLASRDSCLFMHVAPNEMDDFEGISRHSDAVLVLLDPHDRAWPLHLKRIMAVVHSSLIRVAFVHAGAPNTAVHQGLPPEGLPIHHVDGGLPGTVARLARFLSHNEVGLVLSGGGARGLAHIGVLRALEEAGQPIDMIGGCSMGAFVAALYAQGMGWQAIAKKADIVWGDQRFRREMHPPFFSILGGTGLASRVAEQLGRAHIEALGLPFFCVASNLTTAQLLVHKRGSLRSAVLDSGSIPIVSPPRLRNGELIVDGGVLNNVPVDVMRELCNGPIIGVDVCTGPGMCADSHLLQLPSGWRVLVDRLVPGRSPPNCPGILDIAYRAATLSNKRDEVQKQHLADLWIYPQVHMHKTLGFEGADDIIARGYLAAKQTLSQSDLCGALTDDRSAVKLM